VIGVALFGGSILAAGVAVMIAGFSGVQHLRKIITQRSFRDFSVVQLRRGDYDYDAR
jgi:hypothetical protein